MILIQYKIHQLLTSKHRILITFIIYLIFYITIKNTHLVYCMTEGNEMPSIAETKTKVEANINSKKEIDKELNCVISSMSEKIAEQCDKIRFLERKICDLESNIVARDRDLEIADEQYSKEKNRLYEILSKR